MKTLRALESFVRDHPVAYAVVGPSFWGDGMYPPERRRLLPALHEVLRARPAAVPEHRHPRPADPRRGAEPDPPRPGLRALPRAAAVHDPRRRPLVGRRHPADAQVPEPAADDLGVVAEAPARVAAPLHAHAGQGPDPLRLRLPGAVDGALPRRGGRPRPARRRARRWLYGNAEAFFFGRPKRPRADPEGDPMDARPIDADNHYYEPLDAFTRHLDKAFRERGVRPVQDGKRVELLIGGQGQPLRPQPDVRPDHRARLPRPAVPRPDPRGRRPPHPDAGRAAAGRVPGPRRAGSR